MYETDSDQNRRYMECPRSWLLNPGRKMLVAFGQEEPGMLISGLVSKKAMRR